MKIARSSLLAGLLLMGFSADPGLTTVERKVAADYLETTRENLLGSIKGLSADQLNFRSAPDAWSVAECVEHLTLSETNLFSMVEGSLKEEADPSRRKEVTMTDDGVFATIADRTQKIKTKEPFEPTGKFGSHESTVGEFLKRRSATVKYVKTTGDDLRNHYFTFPFGTLDSYQLLIFIAGHTKRHTLQIEEIKSQSGFPKK